MNDIRHQAFVKKFTEFWAAPAVERMSEFLTDDVIFIQPLSYPMEGLVAAQEEFQRLFRWMPDLRGETTHWSGQGETLFIAHTLTGTLGRTTRVTWSMVDRFDLVGDKACTRVVNFDSLPLIWALIKTPSAWWAWWRSGTARPWRR